MQRKNALGVIAILVSMLFHGCGGEEKNDTQASKTPETGTQIKAASGPATGSSAIMGMVKLSGTAPKPARIKMGADANCAAMHPNGDTTSDVVANANGTLKWVFVHVTKGLEGHTYPVPTEAVVIDQRGCRYHPHVFGIMANQPLKIRNSDKTMHNIHSLPKNSRPFNLAMPRKDMELKKKFKNPETMVRIKCDVHPWMECWVGVLDNPFYAVTDDSGHFKIENLPAGTYTVEMWHEKYGTQTQSVTIGDGETKEISFTVQVQT